MLLHGYINVNFNDSNVNIIKILIIISNIYISVALYFVKLSYFQSCYLKPAYKLVPSLSNFNIR